MLAETLRGLVDDGAELTLRTHDGHERHAEALLQHLSRCRASSDLAGAPDSNTTLPDWMYVRTASNPCDSNASRRSDIATLFLPPTLMPRSRATYRFVVIDRLTTR